MKRILVATDGSEGGDRAVDYASGWAKTIDAELLIVNVIGGYGLPDKLVRAFTRAQQVWLRETLASLSSEMLANAQEHARSIGVSVIQLESRAGEVAQTILEIAQEKNVDAIVVGKRGAGRVSGLVLGSVSQKLVSLATVPVTVVP